MKKMLPQERLKRKNEFDASLTVGVERFHRETGRDRHLAEEMEALANSLIDPATGLLMAEKARDRECPVCGGSFSRPIFIKAGFPHGRCPECELIYVNPVLNDQAAREYYREESSWARVLESDLQKKFDRLKFQYGLDAALPLINRDPDPLFSLLDIGAGTGLFAESARDRGLKTTVLELNRENARKMREKGFTVLERPLGEAGPFSEKFDLVTLWEVLEHIVEPRELLEQIYRLMTPAGVLLILVPNADALITRILHEKSGTFGGHSHVQFFNINTLTRLLAETGFTVLEAETLITELGAINSYLDYQDPYAGRADNLFDLLTPDLIHDRLMGSKLLVLATPKNIKE